MFRVLRRSFTSACSNVQRISEVNLVGRDYIIPKNLTAIELKSLIWTAMDLKYLSEQRNLHIKSIENARLTLILDNTSSLIQLPINNAARLLNASVNIIVNNDDNFTEDYGRMLATYSDIILCQVQQQDAIEKISDGANVPVVAVKSSMFNLVKTLADVMTLKYHFNYLKNLTLAWVGPAGSSINTYMHILPRFGVNVKYCIVNNNLGMTVLADDALKICQQHNTELHECLTPSSATYRADVISTSGHNCFDFQVTTKLIDEAAIKWALLHDLPRGKYDVQKEVFNHNNCLVWKSLENTQWICAAIILRLLTGYCNVTQEPVFEKEDNPLHI